MEFALGFIAGVVTAGIMILGMIFLRIPLERAIKRTERRIASVAPRSKGFIVEPSSEADQRREQIVERNQRQGKDTLLSELYDENTEN